MIKNYKALNEIEKDFLFEFIEDQPDNYVIDSMEKMEGLFTSIAFRDGVYVAIDEDVDNSEENNVIGVIATVTKEIETRGEAFITSFYSEHEMARELLDVAELHIMEQQPETILLSLKESMLEEEATVLTKGYIKDYRHLEMTYEGEEQSSDLKLVELNEALLSTFIEINNTAFIDSPNGAIYDMDDAKEVLLSDNKNYIVYDGTTPIGHLELDGEGGIETISVHKDSQGKGYGKKILAKAIEIYDQQMVSDIYLTVMDNNERAFKLYESSGFVITNVLSHWYKKSNTKD